MAISFQILGSSSSGNCAFLEIDGIKMLVDAGLGITKIRKFLAAKSLSESDIDAIFITHEHIDHYAALRSFAKTRAKVFANKATAECIRYKDAATKNLGWRIFETGQKFDFYGVEVQSFPIPHDTSDPVGYTFAVGGKKIAYATDLGKITNVVRDVAQDCNMLVLESNYCPVMLARSKRPQMLKNRISSVYGHLCNADAIALLKTLPQNVAKIYLSHVSRECNSIEHIAELLEDANISSGDEERVEIVSPFDKSGSAFEF